MQPFVLYNSEQRKKVEFVPRKEGHIDMYVCGMTVYDYCHIGHARVMVAFDYIIRFLRSQGWNVKYVRNITDIDDKIIKRANENGESIQALTDRFIQAMNEDAASLGCVEPDVAPRATEYIDQMQNMIGNLVNKGTAYPARNGDVYFQATEVRNKFYEEVPEIVETYMKNLSDLIGIDYKPFNYYGSSDAKEIIVAMGSVCETIKETIDKIVNITKTYTGNAIDASTTIAPLSLLFLITSTLSLFLEL